MLLLKSTYAFDDDVNLWRWTCEYSYMHKTDESPNWVVVSEGSASSRCEAKEIADQELKKLR